MQQVAATPPIVNDTGMLNAEQVPAFRAFLVENGVEVRDSGAGQFCHVRLPQQSRWWPIERGRAGAPVTPEVLRGHINQFKLRPSLATCPATITVPPLPGNAQFDNLPAPVPAPVSPAGATITPLPRYLSDLRDDFALHAPLVQQENESLAAFADRRWEYADVMISARTTKAGD